MNVESSMLRDAKELIVWASKLEARVDVEIHENPPDSAQMEALGVCIGESLALITEVVAEDPLERTVIAANRMGACVDQYGGAFDRRPKHCSRH